METISGAVGALLGVVLRKAGVSDFISGFENEFSPEPPPPSLVVRLARVLDDIAPVIIPVLMQRMMSKSASPQAQAMPVPSATDDAVAAASAARKQSTSNNDADFTSFMVSAIPSLERDKLTVSVHRNGKISSGRIPFDQASVGDYFESLGKTIKEFGFDAAGCSTEDEPVDPSVPPLS